MRDKHPLLIRGGRIVDPASGLDATGDILIADGTIARIETRAPLAPEPGWNIADAAGCLVTPGLIDPHVHFREPGTTHEETVATGGASAVNGGFTTVCCMPNTTPPLDTPERIEQVTRAGRAAAGPRVLVAACATVGRAGREPVDAARLALAGAVAFTDDGECVADDRVLAAVLSAIAPTGRPFMQHCEDPALTEGASMNSGPVAERLGLIGWPPEAEERIIARDIDTVRRVRCRYHAQHLSAGGSADLIASARAEGLPVSAEVSPHHLLLTEEACATLGTAAKMNPPLRRAEDIARLQRAVADGTIDVLATDHAPHPVSRKAVPFAEAAFGVVGLDCALPLYVRALVDTGVIGWPRLIAMMSWLPARLLGIDREGFGRLAEGGPGDVTVIDPDFEWTIRASEFATTGRNCPFEGNRVRGRALAVVAGIIRPSPTMRRWVSDERVRLGRLL